MPDLLAGLEAPIAGAAASVADGAALEVGLERPADASHGDYATAIALRLAPLLKRAPRQIAEDIATRLRGSAEIAAVEVAGPGFVNVRLAPVWFRSALRAIVRAGDSYGSGRPAVPEQVLIELVSANPTGAVTIAGARNGAYGDAVARLLAFAGHQVVREYYFNDTGRQMERFGASVRARKRGEEPPADGYPGDELIALAAGLDLDPDASVEEWTAAAVDGMFDAIKLSLERLRIGVDIWFSEAELHGSGAVARAIARARKGGHVYEADGATWMQTSAFGDDKDRVLTRSDGSPTYFAADLAYVDVKFGRGSERLIYVLGADHHGYTGRLKASAAVLGFDPDRVEVALYQLVTVSGERMGKRRGNVIAVDEVCDAIGVDATRFFLVQRSHDQAMDIDLDLAVQQNATNPVYYVQYAHARIASILRRAAADGWTPGSGPWQHEPEPQEAALVKRLVEWPRVAADAASARAPHRVIAWLHALAKDFHAFHHDLRVLHEDEDVRDFRLALAGAVGSVLRVALDLVGVEAPESM